MEEFRVLSSQDYEKLARTIILRTDVISPLLKLSTSILSCFVFYVSHSTLSDTPLEYGFDLRKGRTLRSISKSTTMNQLNIHGYLKSELPDHNRNQDAIQMCK